MIEEGFGNPSFTECQRAIRSAAQHDIHDRIEGVVRQAFRRADEVARGIIDQRIHVSGCPRCLREQILGGAGMAFEFVIDRDGDLGRSGVDCNLRLRRGEGGGD